MNESSKKSRKNARKKMRMLTTIREAELAARELVSRCSTRRVR